MKMKTSLLRSNQGFTLLEILLVVLLLAIIAAIGITSFVGTTETKNASTKEDLAILRKAVAAEMAITQLDCGASGVYNATSNTKPWPGVTCLNANSITACFAAAANPLAQIGCTTTQVPNFNDQRFVTGNIPVNPWGGKIVGVGNLVVDCTAGAAGIGAGVGVAGPTATCISVANGNTALLSVDHCTSAGAWNANDDGWCYDPTSGAIWANSNNNGGSSAANAVNPPEFAF